MHQLPDLDKRYYRGQGHQLRRIRRSVPDCPSPPRGSPGNTSLVPRSVSRDRCRRHRDRLDQHRARRRRNHRNRHGRCPPERPATSRNVRDCFRRPWITISFIAAVQRTCGTQCRAHLTLRVAVNELAAKIFQRLRFTEEFSFYINLFLNT